MPLPKQVKHADNVLSHTDLIARLLKITGLSKAVVNKAVGAYFDQLHTHLRNGGEYYGAPLGLISTRVLSNQVGAVRTIRFRASAKLRKTVFKRLSAAEAVIERAKHPAPVPRKLSPARQKLLKRRGGTKGRA